jgi:hypothetical protein
MEKATSPVILAGLFLLRKNVKIKILNYINFGIHVKFCQKIN